MSPSPYEATAIAAIDGLQREARRQSGFSATRRSHPDDVPLLGHVLEAVVQRHDLFAVQLGLTREGKCFDLEDLGKSLWKRGQEHILTVGRCVLRHGASEDLKHMKTLNTYTHQFAIHEGHSFRWTSGQHTEPA